MITGGEAAVARATAAVFVDGGRAGSAVLVDPRYLVTAAHVLQRWGTRAEVPAEQVELEFPGLGQSGQPGMAAAAPLDLGPAGAGMDVAVLDLGEDRPGWLPAPVPVWPAARLPRVVKVFGYPLAEGSLNGVWRQFAVRGPAIPGTVQLDWIGPVGTFPGHSGGPVIDAGSHALAGILVEESERGRFDRFAPITLITQVWQGLPRPWLITGTSPGEARSHFTRRARGQRSAVRGGDLFRGRRLALDRIAGWLTADEPPGQPLVITGQPGAGKSAVLARAALRLEADHGAPGLAFHARAATIGDFLTALADLTGMDTPASPGELVTRLADLPGQPPIPVVLDALDEAASDLDRDQITQALAEMAVMPGLRLAVATRPLATGNPYAPGGLLPALGVTTRDNPGLIDLDSDTYFDAEGLRQFAAALLARDGMDHPGPDRAWTQYRTRTAVRDRLAAVIAERAGRNFLVAAMAADPLSAEPGIIDPAASGFDPASIPSRVGEALRKYLGQQPEQRRERVRALLTALAYARGAGLDDPDWLAFAQAMGYSVTTLDLDVLRRSRAADYLLQTSAADRGARPVTRLFHQALTDELLAGRDRLLSDESVLLDMLLGQAERAGWQARYLREHVAEHAAAAGRLDQLLGDMHYLLAADPARLVPHLDGAQSALARDTALVYRESAHNLAGLDRSARASQLELTAHRLGLRSLATRIASAAPDRPWRTCWSYGPRATGHQVLTGHDGRVSSVAVGALPDGTPVIVSGGRDGTARLWRLADGAPVGPPLDTRGDPVSSVAVGALPDGTPVAINTDLKGAVRVWRLADGGPARELLDTDGDRVHQVAVGALPDGTPVIVGGTGDGTVRVWRLADGVPAGEPMSGHTSWVQAVAVGALPDRTAVIVSGAAGSVRAWRLPDGAPIGEPVDTRHGPVHAVAVGALPDGTPVIVSSLGKWGGSSGGMVRVWRLADGAPVGEPLDLFVDTVRDVAVGALPDGTPVIAGAFDGGTVRVWRLADGAPVGEPMPGHDGSVGAVAMGALPDGTSVVVSGGGDGTVRVWRLAGSALAGEPMPGHNAPVSSLAVGTLPDGTPVIVGSGDDRKVRVWRLADGAPVGEPIGHDYKVGSLAVGTLPDGTPVIVSGAAGIVRVWRLADGAPVGEPLDTHGGGVASLAVGALPDGTPVIVGGGSVGSARVWRLADGALVWELRGGGTKAAMLAVAVGALPDGTPVIVGGVGDGTVGVWRLADGAPVRELLDTHGGGVFAVAVGALPDGTPVIVGGVRDGTVRVWRLADGTPVGEPLPGRTSTAAVGALPDGTSVIVGGGDRTVRMWRLADRTPLAPPLDLPARVHAVAVYGNTIVAAAGANITVLKPTLSPPSR